MRLFSARISVPSRVILYVFCLLFCAGCHRTNPFFATPQRHIENVQIAGFLRQPTMFCTQPVPFQYPAPTRIEVTDPALLDDLCALGFQNRVIMASQKTPKYLDKAYPQLERVTNEGPSSAGIPPELVLTTQLYPRATADLSIRTVRISGTSWRERLDSLAKILHSQKREKIILDRYAAMVHKIRLYRHTIDQQINLLDITRQGIFIDNHGLFGSIVADQVGLQHPENTDKKYRIPVSRNTLGLADADVIYITYDQYSLPRLRSLLRSHVWKSLGAVLDRRLFIATPDTWVNGLGYVAARNILADIYQTVDTVSI